MNHFWRGVARMLDLGGTMNEPLPTHDDAKAIADDWRVVGDDLRRAMKAVMAEDVES